MYHTCAQTFVARNNAASINPSKIARFAIAVSLPIGPPHTIGLRITQVATCRQRSHHRASQVVPMVICVGLHKAMRGHFVRNGATIQQNTQNVTGVFSAIATHHSSSTATKDGKTVSCEKLGKARCCVPRRLATSTFSVSSIGFY